MVQDVEDQLDDQLDRLGRVEQGDQLVVCKASQTLFLIVQPTRRFTLNKIFSKEIHAYLVVT